MRNEKCEMKNEKCGGPTGRLGNGWGTVLHGIDGAIPSSHPPSIAARRIFPRRPPSASISGPALALDYP